MMHQEIISYLKDKNLSIVGFGREGKSSYNFIRKYLPEQKITIIDNDEKLLDKNEELKKDIYLNFSLGEDCLNDLEKYDLIIKSPGVKFKDIDVENIKKKITSQLGLILKFFRKNVIGITASKGKSTTTALISEVLKDQGKKVYLTGNIGIPIFDFIENIDIDSYFIVECSAYQLEFITDSPHIGLILNLFEEHLDYFKTKNDYFSSKMNMFKYQDNNDIGIYTSSNETLNEYVKKGNYKSKLINVNDLEIEDNYICYNNKKLYNINDERLLLGKHNLSNIMFVLIISEILNLDINKTTKTINNFKTLEHRMEYVGKFNGIKYYNDAIATIPSATINCIESIPNVDTIIFGGMDRGIDYTPLIEFFNKCDVKNYICMPETGHKIAKSLINKKIYIVETLEEAVKIAMEVTKNTCVMSPAASSYNAFKDFEEKGNCYKKLLNDMQKSKVYFTKNIDSESVIKLYKILGKELSGKVAVKVHSGEEGNQNYLHPEFMKPMIDYINGTVVECNTAYEGERNSTEKHKKLIEKHGWTKYFNVDLLDEEDNDLVLEIPNGKIIKKNYLGENIEKYDSMLVLSHFKGHPMGGFGGALKQLSIGCASSRGKAWIHSAGVTTDQKILWDNLPEQDKFLESMADAASSVVEYFKGNMVFINMLCNISVDCDCCAVAEDPCMKDIGIVASLDPIAIDQACIDLTFNSSDPGKEHFIERVKSRNGIHIIDAATKLNFGTKDYELISIDK